MIKFEAEFKCKTKQEVINALQHIIDRLECDFVCGYLTDVDAEGDWGCAEEEKFDYEEDNTPRIIESDNGILFIEDDERGLLELYPLKKDDVFIGNNVFWIDPCYWRGEEHTSHWGTITDVRGEIIELDNGTEVTIDELYW